MTFSTHYSPDAGVSRTIFTLAPDRELLKAFRHSYALYERGIHGTTAEHHEDTHARLYLYGNHNHCNNWCFAHTSPIGTLLCDFISSATLTVPLLLAVLNNPMTRPFLLEAFS